MKTLVAPIILAAALIATPALAKGGHGGHGGHAGGAHVGGGAAHVGGGMRMGGGGARMGGHHHHHGGFRRGGGIYFGGPFFYDSYSYGYSDCGWLRRRALDTGSRYWWRRYRDCRGY